MAESEHPETLYMAIAEAYDGLGDEAMALKYAYLDIENGRQASTYASRSYRILLRRLAARPAAFEERREAARRATKDFPELPEFHAEYAECLAYGFDYAGACREAAAALAAFDAYHGLEPLQFDAAMRAAVEERRALWEKIQARQEAVTVSACLIARDEARDLLFWLENTAAYSDERVVVDTGSRDETAELARAAGAKVYDFPWQDDFAAARNFALSKATGDWIAFLDADEAFTVPERVRPLLAEVEVLHPEAEAVKVMIANVDEDDGGREFQRFMAVRLFKRRPDLGYRGRVHETLMGENGLSPALYEEKHRLLIRHTGYSTKRVVQKARRNLALLQADIEAHGEGPQHYPGLADAYFGLKAYRQALKYAVLALDSLLDTVAARSTMFHTAIESMRQLDWDLSEMLMLAECAVREFPKKPEFYGERGMILCGMGRLKEARVSLQRAVALYERPEDEGIEAGYYSPRTASVVYARLGELAALAGDTAEAETYFRQALTTDPTNETARQKYEKFCREGERHEREG